MELRPLRPVGFSGFAGVIDAKGSNGCALLKGSLAIAVVALTPGDMSAKGSELLGLRELDREGGFTTGEMLTVGLVAGVWLAGFEDSP